MKKQFFLLSLISVLSISLPGCRNINTEDDYYYKEYLNVNGIDIELYGKGYGTYGQLLPKYCEGSVDSIFDPSTDFSFITTSNDNSSSSYNEIYITLTLNRHISTLSTEFDTEDSTVLSSFRITYKTPQDTEKDNEHSIASSFKKSSTYKVDADVTTMTLYIRQNKYYSSSHKTEELRNKLAHNKFTIKKFIPE